MSDQDAARVAMDPPHPNGSGGSGAALLADTGPDAEGSGDDGGSRVLRIALIAGLIVLAGMWAYALIYSLTRQDPERLADAERVQAEHTCATALTAMRALPVVKSPAPLDKVLVRVNGENAT